MGGGASVIDHQIDPRECNVIQTSPRVILAQLLQLQGIPMDPTDMEPATSKISQVVGRGKSDGFRSYDCFISYRPTTDAGLAEKLYLYLKSNKIVAFLDSKCLKEGEDWKTGCVPALRKSRVFVALISSAGLSSAKDFKRDHSKDRLLLEYELALKVVVSVQWIFLFG